MNPNPIDVPIRVTYYFEVDRPTTRTLTAGARSRTTITVHEGGLGVGRGRAVAAKVESLNGINLVVERPMYFVYRGGGGERPGGHIVLGATTPRTAWYFAEGYTGEGFDEYLTVLNPHPIDANIRITYILADGSPVVRSIVARAEARVTVSVHDLQHGVGRGQEVAAKVESTNGVGVVAERAIYFRYRGATVAAAGGHVVMGIAAPRASWYFAEGYTASTFDQYLTIMNPHGVEARVRLTYFLTGQAPVTRHLTVGANRRATVAVHDAALGVGRDQAVSARVESLDGVGLVVERPMYFQYRYHGGTIIAEGHNAAGAESPRSIWLFAEGYTGPGFDQYLTIMNPTINDAQTRITYYLVSGEPVIRTLVAPANARTTVFVNDPAQGAGPGQILSTKVETTNGVEVVVERPMYFLYTITAGGQTRLIGGAHDVMGYAP